MFMLSTKLDKITHPKEPRIGKTTFCAFTALVPIVELLVKLVKSTLENCFSLTFL